MNQTTEQKNLDIFKIVNQNYENSFRNTDEVSDTWKMAFERKGYFYTKDELEYMLAVGSRVGSLIVDWNFIIDENQLDLSSEVLLKILKLGESDVCHPYKNNLIRNQFYSSWFLRNAIIAARLIEHLEKKNIQNPRIMEIGGGTGQLQCILKKYYGKNLTLYSVDLPETLLIQQWYLLNNFPDVPFTHKTNLQDIDFAEQGFNFINAFCLASQDIEIDVIINIASMQEMRESVVNQYFKYIQKNIVPHGIFLFKNCYGHAIDSIASPSEYPFDQYWKLQDVTIHYSIDSLTPPPGEFLVAILERSPQPTPSKNLQLALRFLWNCLQGRHLIRADIDMDIINQHITNSPTPELIKNLKQKILEDQSDIEYEILNKQHYLNTQSFCSVQAIPNIDNIKNDDKLDQFIKFITKTHSKLFAYLEKYIQSEQKQDPVQFKKLLGDDIHDTFKHYFSDSDYFGPYIASILTGLSIKEAAKNVLDYRYRKTENDFKKIHFSYLLNDIGHLDTFTEDLLKILRTDNLDFLSKLHIFNLTCKAKKEKDTWDDLIFNHEQLREASQYEQILALKALLKFGYLDAAKSIVQSFNQNSFQNFELLWKLLFRFRSIIKSNDEDLYFTLDALIKNNITNDYDQLLYQSLSEDLNEGLYREYMKNSNDNFFKLGRLAGLLLKLGYHEMAYQCIERSVVLRPNNFKHYEYVAQLYFNNGDYKKAKKYYSNALKITPYFRNLKFRKLYCDLPSEDIDNGLFCVPAHINSILLGTNQSYFNFLSI